MIVSWIVKAVRWLLWMDLWRPQSDETKPTSCSHTPEPTVSCPECKVERDRARSYRWKVFLGLLLPCAIQSLDITMCDISSLPCRGRSLTERL